MTSVISRYLAKIGSKGGLTGGKAKRRGNSEYYRRLSAKAAKARRANARARRAAAAAPSKRRPR